MDRKYIEKTRKEACELLKPQMQSSLKRMLHKYSMDLDSLSEYNKIEIENAAKKSVVCVVSKELRTEEDCNKFLIDKNEFLDGINSSAGYKICHAVAEKLEEISEKLKSKAPLV